MTENKRFTMAEDEYTIEDNSKIISVMTREDILFTLNRLNDENEQLKQQLFEARKDYLIETADISDKLYLEAEIEQERKEIFGDD